MMGVMRVKLVVQSSAFRLVFPASIDNLEL
jgi:hypothetical protein